MPSCSVFGLSSRAERGDAEPDVTEPTSDYKRDSSADSSDPLLTKVGRILTNPGAVVLLAVFVGANFVATTFLSWLPMFVSRKFHLNLGDSGLTSTLWPLASLPGALIGGVLADRAFRRWRGGRIGVQSLGLILAAPFVYLTGWSSSWSMLVAALVGAGFCKGIYDANIFASLYDVVRPEDRGTAAGLMNTVGWSGGSVAPPLIGMASDHFGLGVAITATAAVYLLVGLLALSAARLAGDASAYRSDPKCSRQSQGPHTVNSSAVSRDETHSGYVWAQKGDINAFFGLMLDNIGGMILMTSLLVGVFGFDQTFVLTRMIPGTAVGVLVGDLIYTFMAFRLARKTGRTDITAMPLGLDTPSTFGTVFLIIGPAYKVALEQRLGC